MLLPERLRRLFERANPSTALVDAKGDIPSSFGILVDAEGVEAPVPGFESEGRVRETPSGFESSGGFRVERQGPQEWHEVNLVEDGGYFVEGSHIVPARRGAVAFLRSEGFTDRFAKRLDARSDYEVREATDGERIGGGEGLVAPGGKHMVVSNYRRGRLRVKLTEDPPVNSVRPAVDMTMSSAAEVIDDPLVGVILTGMGEDGAAGIKAIKAVGGETIAQDEETSAVFGMPKRAIDTGYVDSVLPIEDIPEGILDTAKAEVNQ